MSTTTANMDLILPDVGSTAGPDYASEINSSLTLVDQHDHSLGKGVPITPAGININDSLDFGGNFATNLAGLTLSAQGTTPSIGTIYESGVDLYYVDGLGNNVRITQSGAVAGTPGSIANLLSPASASYVAASSSFVWESNTNTAADMDGGAVIIREKVANAKGITLQSPSGLASDYALTLMATLPASNKFLSIDSAGNLGASWAVDNSTLEVNTNVLQIKDNGVTTNKINNSAVTTGKIADGAVTPVKKAALGQQISSSSGSFSSTGVTPTDVTNLTVTITTTGRPVCVSITPDTSGNGGSFVAVLASGTSALAHINLVRASSTIAQASIGVGFAGANQVSSVTVPSVLTIIDPVVAGTYTYKVQALAGSAGAQVQVNTAILIAYEL